MTTTISLMNILCIALMAIGVLFMVFGFVRTIVEGIDYGRGVNLVITGALLLLVSAGLKFAVPRAINPDSANLMTTAEKIQMIKENEIPVYLDGNEIENIDAINPSEYNISFNDDETIAYVSKPSYHSPSRFVFIPFFMN